jgi:hypothetical protein
MKIFLFIVSCVYWAWCFMVPVIIMGIPAWLLYSAKKENVFGSILLLLTGIILGILFAERVRKKEGLISFFGRITSSPDLPDINSPKKQGDHVNS